jgi:hypothetical protein
MTRLRWAKFWWDDWLTDPGLNQCSRAAQGLWLRMLCVMARADPPGRLLVNGKPPTVDELPRVLNTTHRGLNRDLTCLQLRGVFDLIDGVITCRRMVREWEQHQQGQRDIRKRWNGDPNRGPNRGNGPDPNRQNQKQSENQSPPVAPLKGGARSRTYRNGFGAIAAEMMEDRERAETIEPRPSGARVVNFLGRPERT